MQTSQGHELADLGKGITEPEVRSPTHTAQPQLWFGEELHLLQFHLNQFQTCPDNCTVKISIKYIAINASMRILVICAYIYEKLKNHMTLACYLIA